MNKVPLTEFMPKAQAKLQQNIAQDFLISNFGITNKINNLRIPYLAKIILGRIHIKSHNHQYFAETNSDISKKLFKLLTPKQVGDYVNKLQRYGYITIHSNNINSKYYTESLPLNRRLIMETANNSLRKGVQNNGYNY